MPGSSTEPDHTEREALFSTKKTADLYHELRPVYTDVVFDRIASFCEETQSGFNLAIDLCCGSGQAAVPISKFFKKVVAVDISEAQIANAPTDIPNVDFKIGSCYDVPSVPSSAVDLVVMGTALHILDHNKVFKEIDRMLKPGGAFIVFNYDIAHIDIQDIADVQVEHFRPLMEHFPTAMQNLQDGHANVKFPYPVIKRHADEDGLERDYSPEEYIQFLGSVPNKNTFNEATGENEVSHSHKQRIYQACQTKCDPNVERPIHAKFTLFMVMTQKPKQAY